jgi:signal transduction histidine kinase
MSRFTVKRDPSKVLQLGFLALLFVCMLQVGWWITDNLLYTREVRSEIEALITTDPAAAAALDGLLRASTGRVNRYVWEGSFFLLVLLAGMAVLTRTIRHDAELRRRQQNFLAAVSHEFKSPLASMQLAAETLVLRSGNDDARRLGERILGDCERLLRMVDNLLDTTRLEEGQHVLAPQTFDLGEVVSREIAAIADRAARHGVETETAVDANLRLTTDYAAAETILRNLLDNALKACIAGGGHAIVVSARRAGGAAELTVRDDGSGFPPEDAELMFEKFYRLGDEQTRSTPGTGLGLYIVKRLAAMNCAFIRAESAGPGHGATFTVVWPEGAAR